jgi:hypothetical protein
MKFKPIPITIVYYPDFGLVISEIICQPLESKYNF